MIKKTFNYRIRRFLFFLKFAIVKNYPFKTLSNNYRKFKAVFPLITKTDSSNLEKIVDHIDLYKSQLRQDLLVLSELNFKKNGFFVEFGSTNGVELSNTFLLEKNFDWKGILAEPAKIYHEELEKNRSAFIEKSCVWRTSGETFTFNEVGVLSTLENFTSIDLYKDLRKDGIRYDTKTISLLDLLEKYNAPKTIDYLSIDTEGSEYDILSSFDFSKYKFKIITCEHNFTEQREKIFKLLTNKGYQRKYTDISYVDDWYFLR